MSTTYKNLIMYFNTELNKVTTITVPYVKNNLTSAEVTAAANAIVTNNIFTSDGGNLTSYKEYKIVTTTVDD